MPRTRSSALPSAITATAFALSTAIALLAAVVDWRDGGQMWRQGDWLINIENVFVRRGIPGSIFIQLSDLLHVGLLHLVLVVQFLLTATTIAITWLAAHGAGISERLMYVLLGPGFFIAFWADKVSTGGRKEVLAFLALALLALTASRARQMPLAVLSAVVFVCAVVAHEAMALFLPLYVVAQLIGVHTVTLRKRLVLAGLTSVAAGAAFLMNLAGSTIPSDKPVCDPLLARGFASSFCDGAIESLTHGLSGEMHIVNTLLVQQGKIVDPIFAYGVAGLPFLLYFGTTIFKQWKVVALFAVVGVPLLPLYAAGADWGRWVAFHFTGVVFLLLILRIRGWAPESPARVSWLARIGIVVVILGIGIQDVAASPLIVPLLDGVRTLRAQL
jgi:hypothetical protein